ncbi:prepilin peptidase [Amylibacter sp. IMCC11727]|uniref:prepilin peptidase n=1 Tax=Amylibacter sp. IMCC11727 TaxID=3039851 RepID=UPI00244D9968|nr:prepilin peptidase [Amylibacter sp. IMCC11727]WGI22851.1 prepilin peptidase [Amylibacter sp. IMCC11727]
MILSAPTILFLTALPFCIWAALTDLRHMKIYNKTNLGLFFAFVIVGLGMIAMGGFTWELYALRIAQGALMLVIGFLLNHFGYMGGGDSKFIGAMAPYIAMQDATKFLMLLAAMALVTVVLHRGIGAIAPLQPHLVGWKSWQVSKKFPYGLTLSSALLIYLAMAANAG